MKTKYDWSGVPKEVKWIATDLDGWMSMHTKKPTQDGQDWLDDDIGYFSLKTPSENPYKGNWQDSLEERPSEN